MISDAHGDPCLAVTRVPGASWRRWCVYWMRYDLAHVPKGQHAMVGAAIRQTFLQPDAEPARQTWCHLADQLRLRWPKLGRLMDDSEHDVLAYMIFPGQRRDEALASFERAVAPRPRFLEPLNSRGALLAALARNPEALSSFDPALADRSDYFEALANRGDALRSLGRAQEALANYTRLLALKPNHAGPVNRPGMVFAQLDRHREALDRHNRAIRLSPDDWEDHNARGIAVSQLWRPAMTWVSFARALSLRPDYAEAFVNNANTLAPAGRPEEALLMVSLPPSSKLTATGRSFRNDGESVWKVFRVKYHPHDRKWREAQTVIAAVHSPVEHRPQKYWKFSLYTYAFIISITAIYLNNSSIVKAEELPSVELPSVVVVGTRISGGIDTRDSNVTIINRDQIEALHPSSGVELFRTLPGVFMQQEGARGSVASIFVRGAKPNFTVVMIDGVKVNDQTNTRGGSFDFSTLRS